MISAWARAFFAALPQVEPPTDHLAVPHHHRPDRDLPDRAGAAGQREGQPHIIVVVTDLFAHLKYSKRSVSTSSSRVKVKKGAGRIRSVRPIRFLRVG